MDALNTHRSIPLGFLLLTLYGLTVPTAPAQCDEPKFTREQLALPGKRGVCFQLIDPAKNKAKAGSLESNLLKMQKLEPSWNYSWGADWMPKQKEYVSSEFVPMIWGSSKSAETLGKLLEEKIAPRIKDGTIKRLLAFNEPDMERQSNMTYKKAIELWPQFMKLGVPLCSPACANPEGRSDTSTQGVAGTWMVDFMKEADARSYRVDYIGVHWYGGTNAESFKKKMKTIYEKYGKRPLLISEFAPADWKTGGDISKHHLKPAAVLEFMQEVLPWMEEQDWIAGYAWFPFSIDSPEGTSSALLDRDGNLTACGRYYKSVTPKNPKGDRSIRPDPIRK